MTRQELRAAFQRLKGKAQHCVAAAELLSRLAEEILEREDTTAPEGQPRAAATRTLQLMAEVDGTGNLVAIKSVQQYVGGIGELYLQASASLLGAPTNLSFYAAQKSFPSSPRAVFLAVSADGQHHTEMSSVQEPSWGYGMDYLKVAVPLKQPICLSRGGKNMLLLACYFPQQ